MEMGLVLSALSVCFVVGEGRLTSCHNYACKAPVFLVPPWVGDLFMARHPPLIRETK